MSAEQKDIDSKTTISTNWPLSKPVISQTLGKFYDLVRGKDANFREKTAIYGGYDLGGFLYDLGHSGRGMDNFPSTIELEFSNKDIVKNERETTIETTLENIGLNIVKAVEAYRPISKDWKGKERNFEKDLEVLRLLNESYGKRKVILKLDNSMPLILTEATIKND